MKRLLYLASLLIFLNACSQQTIVSPYQQAAWDEHRHQLVQLQDWNITGRVGLYTNDEAWPGDILWKQVGSQYDMRIIAPLGAGTLRVHSVEGGVLLEHSSNPTPYFSAEPEALLKKQFGWEMPVRHLRYWMTGIPSPLIPISGPMDLNAQGYLNSLKQSGWLISFKRYKKIAGYTLPVKVLLEHQDLSIKIVIRKWQI